MQSAFGVEHGDDVSKAFGMSMALKPLAAVGTKVASGLSRGGRAAGQFGAKNLKAGNLNRAGLGGSVGNRMNSLGRAAAARPAAAGAAVVGGTGAAGAGVGMSTRPKRQF